MSGIVGIFNLDAAPVDRLLLAQMTDFLTFRGRDAQHIWIEGHVGFGHALLRTTDESLHERQPCSLDGEVWITADARIDDRQNLINKLAAHGRDARLDRPDVELILHAYHAWGDRCVEQLLGDFAFAIWDARQRRLLCARDHFGIKPLYYGVVRNCLVVSNTLNCVRLHPDISDKLNDLAIADFLLFSQNQDLSTTTFADIQRLPPAHTLTCAAGTAQVDRYWMLPTDGDIRYRRQGEYVEQLKELLRDAVEDRLRAVRVGVFMSGGMDSSAVAATARMLARTPPTGLDLHAFTVVYDSLVPDEERHYTDLVARALDIPVHYLSADGYELYEHRDRPEFHAPEPDHEPYCFALCHDQMQQVASHTRVALTGEGGDPAMVGSSSYALSLLKTGAWGRLAADLWHTMSRGKLPRVGFRAHLRRWLRQADRRRALPAWVNPDLAASLDLAARWHEMSVEQTAEHTRRPEAWLSLTNASWPYLFESYDPGFTRYPVEHRYPFFDLRVLTYLMAIPPLPWCHNKEILRSAMAGLLPEPVRRRPKAPFFGNPMRELLQREESLWVDRFEAAPELERYVVRERVPALFRERDSDRIWTNLRPLSLNYWLLSRNHSIDGLKASERPCMGFVEPIIAGIGGKRRDPGNAKHSQKALRRA